jgi:SdrD B-like domain/Protein of unknown function (DUF3048) C-terminal domain
MVCSALRFSILWIVLSTFLLGNCTPNIPTQTSFSASPTINPSDATQSLATASAEAIQPALQTQSINPLTGLPVADPSLLQLPALLVSISHFPITARPQAGLSFAPYVFEIYITEGATRFLTTFYGEYPAPEAPLVGNCDVRREPFVQTNLILGNQVWLDVNKNNIHEPWERGVGGVCVNLYDKTGALLQQTTTDSNGYYGFNVEPGKYLVAFFPPPGMAFTQKDAGTDENDSDVDPASGRADVVDIVSSFLHLDAGLTALSESLPTSVLPPARVGPVRSGRLIYADIADFFPDSCLIYAFASAEVLEHLPKCYFVQHEIQGGGYMLDISEMVKLANDSKKPDQKIDYSSNIYSAAPPAGGVEASKLHVYIAWLNQSEWLYNPLYESWWRYVDNADEQSAGVVHPDVDRLTGRQLHFENVIVLYAKHDVISPTNLDIHLEQDWVGDALLFRDGKMYKIRWSTVATDEEVRTERRKPIQFFNLDDKTPFPLKPGHTWIIVVTPETTVAEESAGQWLLQFFQPPGAK